MKQVWMLLVALAAIMAVLSSPMLAYDGDYGNGGNGETGEITDVSDEGGSNGNGYTRPCYTPSNPCLKPAEPQGQNRVTVKNYNSVRVTTPIRARTLYRRSPQPGHCHVDTGHGIVDARAGSKFVFDNRKSYSKTYVPPPVKEMKMDTYGLIALLGSLALIGGIIAIVIAINNIPKNAREENRQRAQENFGRLVNGPFNMYMPAAGRNVTISGDASNGTIWAHSEDGPAPQQVVYQPGQQPPAQPAPQGPPPAQPQPGPQAPAPQGGQWGQPPLNVTIQNPPAPAQPAPQGPAPAQPQPGQPAPGTP